APSYPITRAREERAGMRPRLKSRHVIVTGDAVVIYRTPTERIHLADDNGQVAALVDLLAQGTRPVAELPDALSRLGHPVATADVRDSIDALDAMGLLEDSDAGADPETLRRHESNLRFYDTFADLHRSSRDLHRAVADASVLVIGAGGLGGGVLQSLLGLGVGRVRIVDFDTVEPKNLARQFIYGTAEIGRPKVAAAAEWARRYAPQTVVDAVAQEVTDVETIRALGADVDLVVLAADQPAGMQLITNEACFALDVPYVAGGFTMSTLFYWSVRPGHTPCRLCLELHRDDDGRGRDGWVRDGLRRSIDPVNSATGPVAQLLSGLISLEAQRYLSGMEEPVAAARYQTVEVGGRMRVESTVWRRHPDCGLCAGRAAGVPPRPVDPDARGTEGDR
ncbi:HesA/MoeB/ThiF family protein, partial [Micromonospora citrea]|uniref:HesA/MoeB/ThiF family protein n=1 Tax=Micromonospora citrea TaxID=47855 RepID=UPI003C4C148C